VCHSCGGRNLKNKLNNMFISLNWLKDYVDIPKKYTPKELADLLTIKTAEVEGVNNLQENLENCVIGKILKIEKHPNADKLKLCEVDIGTEKKHVVCGGNNLKEGMTIAFAKLGAFVKWHGEGDLIKLEKAVIRGETSEGMICAGEEIGIEKAPPGGITDLNHIKAKPGTPLAKALNKDDIILEVDNKSLTHRPDLWGHYGIAREVAAITNSKLKPIKSTAKIPIKGEMMDIKVDEPKLCPRYCGLIIKNIKVEESPDWLKAKIIAAGYRPISNIVDVTNFVMAELGQPLHAFDKKFIEKGIIVRRAHKNETIKTLDGQKRNPDETMLLITDHKKPVAIAGVMGGENSEINNQTTEIFIESANFNPASVRKTSVKLGLRTEAVQRFEKSLDPNLAELSIKRAAEIILKICPKAEIAGPITDINNAEYTPKKITLSVSKANSIIGADISEKKITEIFKNLEFKTAKKSKDLLEVEIPSFRATKDINIEEDLIEEVARIFGYNNIKPTLPELPIEIPRENQERSLKHITRQILSSALGYSEVSIYSFYGKDELRKCLMSEENHLFLDNYLSADQTHLRTTLIPNLLKAAKNNLRFEDNLKIYEIGRVFFEIGKEFPHEIKNLALISILPKKSKDQPFYEIKSTIENYLKIFKAPNYRIEKSKKAPPYAHPGECADILIQDKLMGQIFTINPLVLKNWDIQDKAAAAEINFTLLAKLGRQTTKYEKIPKFPSMDFDVSVLIDKNTEYSQIEKAIKKAEKDLISNVELFDHYEGQNIAENKKALAFKIILQSQDRTLTDQDMTAIQTRIFANLKQIGGEIRGA
jgi:phenylalanyl-tRNA synthetase beta chain